MKDWSDLKRVALRAQQFNATDYAVTSLGSCASDVLDLIAENESLRRDARILDILVEAMAEVKATSDGNSDQPIADIVSGCLAEIAANRSPENPS